MIKLAGITAVNWLELTKVVVSGVGVDPQELHQVTVETPFTKLVPFTVRVVEFVTPMVVPVGDMEVKVGPPTVKVSRLDVTLSTASCTAIDTVPTVLTSEAVMVAVIEVPPEPTVSELEGMVIGVPPEGVQIRTLPAAKSAPVIIRENVGLPTAMLLGFRPFVLICGPEAMTKGWVLELTRLTESETLTVAVPAVVKRLVGTVAVRDDAELAVIASEVVCPEKVQLTSVFTIGKLLPVSVRLMGLAALTIANCWLSEVRVGFGLITKFCVLVGDPLELLITPT